MVGLYASSQAKYNIAVDWLTESLAQSHRSEILVRTYSSGQRNRIRDVEVSVHLRDVKNLNIMHLVGLRIIDS